MRRFLPDWKITALFLCAVSGCVSRPAGAQARRSSADTELLLAGEQTVTTVSKKAQRVGDVPSAVTVITEEDIRMSGATTLLDVLRSAPGVDVMEPNSAVANVSVRGFNQQLANKLLIMVDGRSIFQDTYGEIFWNTNPLLLSQIKRIEIVRGPGSALYGANAFNGVINIITKTPAELAAKPSKTSFRTLIGDRNSQFSEILTSGGDAKQGSYALGLAYNHTDGLGERKAGNVRDSYTIPIVTLDLQKPLKRGSLRFSAGNSEAVADFAELTLDVPDSHWHTSYLTLAYNEEKVKNPILARFSGTFLLQTAYGSHAQDTHTYDIEVQQQRSLSTQHNLVYGASYRYFDSLVPFINPDVHRQELYALYAQDDIRLAKQTHLFAGVRLDEHSLFGFHFTPRLSLVHHLPRNQSLRLSYGTAFRNPTIVSTYVDISTSLPGGLSEKIQGNIDLKPETVTSYEAGYRREFSRGFAGINLFYNQINDLIDFAPTAFAPSPPFPAGIPVQLTAVNARNATAAGLELESEYRLGKGVRALFNYAYQDVEDNMGERVDLSPQHKINLGIQAQMPHGWEAYLGVHFVGASVFHNNGVPLPVDSYTRVDARLGYRFGKPNHSWTLSWVATNLFDDKHLELPKVTAPGSPVEVAQQRRTFYVMLTGKL